ncbi:MAG: nicotinate-nucleotide adenylyltransferase [Verrucomicrobiia bacterium]
MKLAVFGGTFNPVHAGHLQVADNLLRVALADRVVFMPARIPPHKADAELAPGADRIEMVRLAIGEREACEVSSIEVRREGPSYTADTLRALASERPGDSLHFVLGSDNFSEVGKWVRFEELAGLCEFLVVERPGFPLRLPPPSVPPSLREKLSYRVVPGPTVSIASSDLRRMLRAGEDVSRWLSPHVLDYIRTRRLYGLPP